MQYKIISDYLDYCQKVKRLSPHTIRAYRNDLNHFYNSNKQDVNDYLEDLVGTIHKSSTMKRKIATLKTFYRYLEDKELIEENPLRFKYFKIKTEKELPKTIPRVDLDRLFTYLKQTAEDSDNVYSKRIAYRNWLLFSFLFSTGLRISELCQLTIERINRHDRLISIVGKGKKERTIYLGDDTTVGLLNTYLENYHQSESPYLFPGKETNSCLSDQNVRRLLRHFSQKLNLSREVTPHMFRHTFATMLLDNDVDIRYIQQILGHSSIAITEIYTHVSHQKQKEILTKSNPMTLLTGKVRDK